ncbi:hypothetical protein EDB84DRAFT_532351 [Lactarius hengduanensis]|nr:hypothetical protein EDB84DRAFT_532351 [Lactarius hengduanensis]
MGSPRALSTPQILSGGLNAAATISIFFPVSFVSSGACQMTPQNCPHSPSCGSEHLFGSTDHYVSRSHTLEHAHRFTGFVLENHQGVAPDFFVSFANVRDSSTSVTDEGDGGNHLSPDYIFVSCKAGALLSADWRSQPTLPPSGTDRPGNE